LNLERRLLLVSCIALIFLASSSAQEARIRVYSDQPLHEVSRYMAGACIEDVNHEIYGGIYSQMIFGESFQEPPLLPPIAGFKTYGGSWIVKEGELFAGPGDGPKLVSDRPPLKSGDVSVNMMFPDAKPGLAGLILRVSNPAVGADKFTGYEVSLDPGRQRLLIGRHRQNWEPIQETPCKVPTNAWIELSVRMTGNALEINVDSRKVATFDDVTHPLPAGNVGLRTWQRDVRFQGLRITGESIPFRADNPTWDAGVSGMWRGFKNGSVNGSFSLQQTSYSKKSEVQFHGIQCQRIEFKEGQGEIGVENRGLNRWGLNFVAGKIYEGYIWLRSPNRAEVALALETSDGRRLREHVVVVDSKDWERYSALLTPSASDSRGRFSIKLKKPGSVDVGYVFLQPGEWGRFKGLPVRRDVAEGLINQGITVLRLGGLMANAPEYRWKNMLGPRDRRQPYKGFWYPHSSNGWGVIEFLDFCEAAGFLAVPDLNIDETPQDLADFVEYVNGPPESEWGKRRVQDGRTQPYRLKHLELGNEEAVDEAYWPKFKPIAEAVWTKDPSIILIVGDFEYKKPITDPFNVEGAPRIKSLAAHKKILDLAKEHRREVWFDVHIWNHNPGDAPGPIAALRTFANALEKLTPGADFKLCVLEENATNHAMRRAVAHAETINGLMRLGDRVKIVCAANCLQPDGQNDNGWDQGLLFLNPSQVWGQPPSYVTQMASRHCRPRLVQTEFQSHGDALDAVATTGADGCGLTLQVVNRSGERVRTRLQIDGARSWTKGRATQIQGALDDVNTAADPERITSWVRDWKPATSLDSADGTTYTFPPHSFTILTLD